MSFNNQANTTVHILVLFVNFSLRYLSICFIFGLSTTLENGKQAILHLE